MVAIDTSTNVSGHLDLLAQHGVTAVGRYYSPSSAKRLTKAEALAISQAGMNIFSVYEEHGDPELSVDKGTSDAQLALAQAQAVGQPEGTAIYFALEHLPHGYTSAHLPGIKTYMTGVNAVLQGRYRVGVYSDGVVCDGLLAAGLCHYTWLSASSSFEGTQAFRASGRWSIAQGHIDIDWNGLGVDIDEVKPDFGGFRVVGAGAGVAPAMAWQVPPAPPMAALAGGAAAAAAGFAVRARDTATAQWTFFGGQTYDVNGHLDHPGHTEGEDGWRQRVGVYWLEGTNTHGLDGSNHDWPWSAAFISWVMKTAGAENRFRYSTQHSTYISQGIRDFLQKRQEAGYWTVRLTDAAPAVGDIVCWSRQAGIDYDHQNGGDYKGHSDVVVEVAGDRIWIIGGNVGNSVTRRPLGLTPNGLIVPIEQNGEKLFGLMKNRIP